MQKSTSTPETIMVHPPIEDIETIEKEEKETAKIIKQLVSAHQLKFSENDFKQNFNIFQNVAEVKPRVRHVELHDIELEEKSESEIQDPSETEKAILDQFEISRKMKTDKNYSSSIEQFLFENNLKRQNNIIKQKQEPQPEFNKKMSKQMTMDSQASHKTERVSSPIRKARRLTT